MGEDELLTPGDGPGLESVGAYLEMFGAGPGPDVDGRLGIR